MRSVLDHLTADDEIGLVRFGQSNGRPWGHRDREGFVQAPHLKLRPAGMDLTILAIVSATGGAHGGAGTRSIVTVGEALSASDWINAELRLVQHEYGDSVTSTRRRGHARVLANGEAVTAFVGFDEDADTVLWNNHGRPNGSQVTFVTTDTLPGLTAGTVYFVVNATAHTFQVSVDPYGSAIDLSGGVGTHTATGRPYLLVEWVSDFQVPDTNTTFVVNSPGLVVQTAHGLTAGSTVSFSGTLPPELTAGVQYYVVLPAADIYAVAATYGGLPINFSGAGGTATATPQMLAFVSGYVHLHDRFNSYDNVHIVTPYQPIEPGDYPAGPPVVPGYTLESDVLGYADTAVVLPYAWNEGVDGYGQEGVASVSGLVITLTGGTAFPDDLFAGGFVRVAGAKGKVATNTTSTITVEAWEPAAPTIVAPTVTFDAAANRVSAAAHPFTENQRIGFAVSGGALPAGITPGETFYVVRATANDFALSRTAGGEAMDIPDPGSGTITASTGLFVVWLPHWRNNPHHYRAGEGFLYPSNDMQPGGMSKHGLLYSRPRGRLEGSYVSASLAIATTSAAINGTAGNFAQLLTANPGELIVTIASGKLRIMRSSPSSDPSTGLIQFEAFLRGGYIVQLAGFAGLSAAIDGTWRVDAMAHTYGAAGSFIELVQYSGTTPAVPASISGTVPAGASVTRLFQERQHRFGSLVEVLWRMAVSLGRRMVAVHLAINSAGQILRNTNNAFTFQGQLGWHDDDENLDWTPSNDNGVAARMQRLIEFIAPRAVRASLGTTRQWKVLAIDGWQAEADALSEVGREIARRSIPTFANWLSSLIEAAGLSPYPQGAKIPLHWAQVSNIPYEIAGEVTEYPGFVFTGDSEGKVNSAIRRMAALRGFAASIDTDATPKLDGTTVFGTDPLHFNGIGEAQNGAAAAAELLPLIEVAFQFSLGPGAIDVANEALALIGETANVTALEPPNATVQAKECARFLPKARDQVLQAHPWTFATRRTSPLLLDETVSSWAYAYGVPPDLLYPTAVLDPEAPDDLQVRALKVRDEHRGLRAPQLEPASQPFKIETDQEGNRILRTDQAAAVLIYVARNVPTEAWDPLVRQALVHRLAHLLAGVLIKGKTGAAVAQQMLQVSEALMARAATQNAEWQQDVRPEARCPWLP